MIARREAWVRSLGMSLPSLEGILLSWLDNARDGFTRITPAYASAVWGFPETPYGNCWIGEEEIDPMIRRARRILATVRRLAYQDRQVLEDQRARERARAARLRASAYLANGEGPASGVRPWPAYSVPSWEEPSSMVSDMAQWGIDSW